MPKTLKNIHEQLCDPDNIVKGYYNAQKGKGQRNEVLAFARNLNKNLISIWHDMHTLTYQHGTYRTRIINERKERVISIAPFRDRVVHHCLMNIVAPLWETVYINNTYACRKGYGIHRCLHDVSTAMRDVQGTQYALQIDIVKFYDNVDHDILKAIERRRIGDERLMYISDNITDSFATGLPKGNYTSQYKANLYLAYFDHFVKEQLGVKHYFRYMDDMVFLSPTKEHLRCVLDQVRAYLHDNLRLAIKSNYQIYPVDARAVDFVGYKIDHRGVALRKSILRNYYRRLNTKVRTTPMPDAEAIKQNMSSYWGWLSHCSAIHFDNVINRSIKTINHA